MKGYSEEKLRKKNSVCLGRVCLEQGNQPQQKVSKQKNIKFALKAKSRES